MLIAFGVCVLLLASRQRILLQTLKANNSLQKKCILGETPRKSGQAPKAASKNTFLKTI